MTTEELKDRLSSLADHWFDKQVEYEQAATEKADARHAARLNGKAQAYRNCWKELHKLLAEDFS